MSDERAQRAMQAFLERQRRAAKPQTTSVEQLVLQLLWVIVAITVLVLIAMFFIANSS